MLRERYSSDILVSTVICLREGDSVLIKWKDSSISLWIETSPKLESFSYFDDVYRATFVLPKSLYHLSEVEFKFIIEDNLGWDIWESSQWYLPIAQILPSFALVLPINNVFDGITKLEWNIIEGEIPHEFLKATIYISNSSGRYMIAENLGVNEHYLDSTNFSNGPYILEISLGSFSIFTYEITIHNIQEATSQKSQGFSIFCVFFVLMPIALNIRKKNH